MRSLESDQPQIEISALPNSDVVVVLGGMIQTISGNGDRAELSESSDRLVDAVRIYRAGKAKKILFSGGSGALFGQDIREADLAEKLLLDLGIKKEDLILERESRNTHENALESEKLIQANKFESIILVTSASHMKRANGCFQKQNLIVTTFPTDYRSPSFETPAFDLWVPSPNYLDISTIAIKEWVGILTYKIKGYI